MDFKTFEGHEGAIDFQVADVKRPLLSVTSVTKRGSTVVFDEGGSYNKDNAQERQPQYTKETEYT